MAKLPIDDPVVLTRRLRYRAVGDDGVLVHLDSGRVIVVNEVGLYVLQQLKQPMTRQALVEAIVGEFNVDTQQAEQDLERYLQELGAEQLLKHPAVEAEE